MPGKATFQVQKQRIRDKNVPDMSFEWEVGDIVDMMAVWGKESLQSHTRVTLGLHESRGARLISFDKTRITIDREPRLIA